MLKADVSSQLQYAVVRRFESFYSGGHACPSPDGSLLFCTHANVIRVLDVQSGVVRFTVGDEKSDAQVTCFSLDSEGRRLIVAYENLLLKLWSVQCDSATIDRTWKLVGKGHTQRIFQGSGSHGHLFVTGASDGSIKLWNLQLNTCIGSVRCQAGLITALCLSDSLVIFGTDTGSIWLWQTESNSSPTDLRYHSAAVSAVIAHDGLLYSSSRDMTIAVWNLEKLQMTKSIPLFESVECLLYNCATGTLIAAGEKGIIKELDPATGKALRSGQSLRARIVQLHCSGADNYVAVTEDDNFHLVDAASLTVRCHLMGSNGIVNDVTFVSDQLVAVALNSADIRLYKLASGDCQLLAGHRDIVLSVVAPKWSSCLVLSTCKDNTARIWRLFDDQQARCVCLGPGHTASVTTARWSNHKSSFCVTASEDRTFKIFLLKDRWFTSANPGDPETLVEMSAVVTQVAHASGISCLAVAPNDRLLASGSMDKTVKVWNLSPDGKKVKLAGTIEDHRRGVWDVQFSTVDQVLASASGDLTVKMFSLPSLVCLRTFQGHDSVVLRVLFAPTNSTHLLSSDGSGLLKLWEVKTSVCINTYDAHEGKLWAMAHSKNGKMLVTGGEDGKILIWNDVTTEKKVQLEMEHQESVKQEQILANFMNQRRFSKALRLAVSLRRPKTVLHVLQQLLIARGRSGTEQELAELPTADLQTLLSFCLEWNTNSHTYQSAQLIISVLFRKYPFEEIVKWPNAASTVRDLLPYSVRHFDRLTCYRQKLATMSYIINCSDLVGNDLANGGMR